MNMKYIFLFVTALAVSFTALAQTPSEIYERRYNLLVGQVGVSGVGVETVLDNWARVDSTNARMLAGRFEFYFDKAQTTVVVAKKTGKYLGMEPLLSLKDTTGTDVYYFQDSDFDDELYGKAIRVVDKAIRIYPEMLDFRFMKANAYIAYEKESPDMALVYLLDLISQNAAGAAWEYGGEPAGDGFFSEAMQDYCYNLYTIGSPNALDAFLTLSLAMLENDPGNPAFLNNVGTYYLIKEKDNKTALKYYNKILKKHPDDANALQNALIAARRLSDDKLVRKYLKMKSKIDSAE